ncbi:flagellar export chaperone FliS [Cellulosilyticum sp. ST5]|uniref:flagellar export chaperone FliS n=1 Tax=unclassified Cellulosilyticum TaxID=2643091 RepID=UPI000F8F4141|nr:flagellar export chaperone FliS [Cellulosilyticum sp. WCF-2]QEH70823.1 flagellar export chaperone FliS [Cellulosilyticum sp. WCF-2]
MGTNPYMKYQENSITTASGPELTLMLYNGAIKFCNIAIEAIKEKNIQKAHDNIVKVENIIDELRATLNKKYAIALEMDELYAYIYQLLVEGNFKKDIQKIEDACMLIRNYRDAWQIAMKAAK